MKDDINKLYKKMRVYINSPEEILVILDKFIEEAEKGQILAYNGKIHYFLGIHCVPKKDEFGRFTKFRVVRNGSICDENTISLNELIRKIKCKMPSLPNLAIYAKLFLKNNYFAIRDLKDCFRYIPLFCEDQQYVLYSLFGMVWKDTAQPYGVASAAANAQYFSSLLIWILDNKIFDNDWAGNTLVHIDDFVLCAKSEDICVKMQNRFDNLMRELGVEISRKVDSYVNCCQEATIYGIFWNLKVKKCSISAKKLKKFKTFLLYVMQYRVLTGKALEYIAGMILHLSQLNKLSKCLAWNIIRLIHNYIRNGIYKKTDCLILPLYIIRDLRFWFLYSDNIKTVDIADIIYTPSIAIYGSSDACDTGAGFIIGNNWSPYKFDKEHIKNWHINQKELHAVLTAIHTFKNELTGKKLIMYIDNSTACYGIINKWSSTPQIMFFIYELCLLMIEYKIVVFVNWISSNNNGPSDALSRGNNKEFWRIKNLYNLQLNNKPTPSRYYRNFRFINNNKYCEFKYVNEYDEFVQFLKLPYNTRIIKGYYNYARSFSLNNPL